MKLKTTRICACKGCNNEFKLYKSTDKFCSPACAYQSQKLKPIKKQEQIRQVSQKRQRESYAYAKKRKTFLELPENRLCPVAKEIFNEEAFTCEVHHKAGRRGKFLLYVPFWLAVCRKGHDWIHANPAEAYQKGFLLHSSTKNI